MDLRRVVHHIMQDWGVDVLLQRRIYNKGTGMYSLPLDTSTTDPDESYYSKTLERWTVRYTFAGRKTALTGIEIGRPEGEVHGVPLVFYFTYDAKPKEGDRIYISDDRYNDPISGAQSTWLVSYAEGVVGWHGRKEYWEVGAHRELPS